VGSTARGKSEYEQGKQLEGTNHDRLAGRGLCVLRATAGALLINKMVPLW